jgi:hypothetical protein
MLRTFALGALFSTLILAAGCGSTSSSNDSAGNEPPPSNGTTYYLYNHASTSVQSLATFGNTTDPGRIWAFRFTPAFGTDTLSSMKLNIWQSRAGTAQFQVAIYTDASTGSTRPDQLHTRLSSYAAWATLGTGTTYTVPVGTNGRITLSAPLVAGRSYWVVVESNEDCAGCSWSRAEYTSSGAGAWDGVTVNANADAFKSTAFTTSHTAYLGAQITSPWQCPTGSYLKNGTTAASCVAAPGYYGANGAAAFTACPAGKYSEAGGTAATACTSCIANATSAAASDSSSDCTCIATYGLVDAACVRCNTITGLQKWVAAGCKTGDCPAGSTATADGGCTCKTGKNWDRASETCK